MNATQSYPPMLMMRSSCPPRLDIVGRTVLD
jgi:hypothetical protein